MEKKPQIKYVTVVLPLALPNNYTYEIPNKLADEIQFGIRVEVPLRNKLYAALVVELHEDVQIEYKTRKIISVIDQLPIITTKQYELWKWITKYYSASMGEVMNVALPSGMKLTSETIVVLHNSEEIDFQELNDDEFLVTEALTIQGELRIDEIRKILDKKTVYPVIKSLVDKLIVYVKEELKARYKEKKKSFISLQETYLENPDLLTTALDLCARSEKQTKTILLLYQKFKNGVTSLRASEITNELGVDSSVFKALEKKEIIDIRKEVVSRIPEIKEGPTTEMSPLSPAQEKALIGINSHFAEGKHVLLHGVTGSGKTRVYMELIRECLEQERQILYLLPEIALTTQVVNRLSEVFGNQIGLYHSKLNNHQRVELWKSCYEGKPIILGARSSLFMPFQDLGLIIIDEEHDPSFKQNDPNPRYNGRDTAVYLAGLHGAKVVLGTATPSLESYNNALSQKYGLVSMTERYGNVQLPEIEVVDLKLQYRSGQMYEFVSKPLREAIEDALAKDEQVLLFQNRRGFSPTIQCTQCEWVSECGNCDVSLTYHQFRSELRCHYCGYREQIPSSCPSCGHTELVKRGFGTEKIEHVIQELFPSAKAARMDYDTANTKNAMQDIIHRFEDREIDILVGTQMITKGLDFDNIGLVGILNADSMIQFPDFRAHERAFQLFTQVAGRAGRRQKKGRVILQTFQPTHPIILETVSYNFPRFFQREMKERKSFIYPPHFRMVEITLKHKQAKTVFDAANYLSSDLRQYLKNRIIGPSEPGIARIRGFYLQRILVKLEKKQSVIDLAKAKILESKHKLQSAPGFKSVRVNIDVDPY